MVCANGAKRTLILGHKCRFTPFYKIIPQIKLDNTTPKNMGYNTINGAACNQESRFLFFASARAEIGSQNLTSYSLMSAIGGLRFETLQIICLLH